MITGKQIAMIQDAFIHESIEGQFGLARQFDVNTYKWVTRDRMIGAEPRPSQFDSTMKRMKSNAQAVRYQQRKRMKQRRLASAYKPTTSSSRKVKVSAAQQHRNKQIKQENAKMAKRVRESQHKPLYPQGPWWSQQPKEPWSLS